jgi:hypothetical protein
MLTKSRVGFRPGREAEKTLAAYVTSVTASLLAACREAVDGFTACPS